MQFGEPIRAPLVRVGATVALCIGTIFGRCVQCVADDAILTQTRCQLGSRPSLHNNGFSVKHEAFSLQKTEHSEYRHQRGIFLKGDSHRHVNSLTGVLSDGAHPACSFFPPIVALWVHHVADSTRFSEPPSAKWKSAGAFMESAELISSPLHWRTDIKRNRLVATGGAGLRPPAFPYKPGHFSKKSSSIYTWWGVLPLSVAQKRGFTTRSEKRWNATEQLRFPVCSKLQGGFSTFNWHYVILHVKPESNCTLTVNGGT